jgi:hypothetical protein
MSKLTRFVNAHFTNVIKYSCIGNNYKNDLIFHNYYRLKKISKSDKTYNGEYNCGITSFILGNFLKKHIPIKMYLYEFGYGKYKEDHVFLKYKDIIIDPTYRQFFTDNRKNGVSSYNNYLYEDLLPFFVGSQYDLQKMYITLKEKNKEEFDYCNLDEEILDNWKEKHDITLRLDDFSKLNEKEFIYEMINKI